MPVEYVDTARGTPSPFNRFLATRGLQILPLRMATHNDNARRVAEFLEKHPAVARVTYPGLRSHPQHEVARRQMHGFGGMVGLELIGEMEASRRMINALQLWTRAVNLRDVKTLISRRRLGFTDGLVQLSVGLEDFEDPGQDLDRALRA